jgi:hypothetical protein
MPVQAVNAVSLLLRLRLLLLLLLQPLPSSVLALTAYGMHQDYYVNC